MKMNQPGSRTGAGDEVRTRDPLLGKEGLPAPLGGRTPDPSPARYAWSCQAYVQGGPRDGALCGRDGWAICTRRGIVVCPEHAESRDHSIDGLWERTAFARFLAHRETPAGPQLQVIDQARRRPPRIPDEQLTLRAALQEFLRLGVFVGIAAGALWMLGVL